MRLFFSSFIFVQFVNVQFKTFDIATFVLQHTITRKGSKNT